MKKFKVVKRTALPSNLPIFKTMLMYVVLDIYNAPQWMWGAVGLLMFYLWVTALICIFTEEEEDIFRNGD